MYFKLKIFALFIIVFETIYCESIDNTGCPDCQNIWCPKIETQCLYGVVEDLCGCCPNGICAKIEGEDCYDENLIPKPSLATKKYGTCGKDLKCEYSVSEEEYKDEDMPNALCICEDNRQVCASDNKTYNSICDLNLHKIKNDISDDKITIKNYGPCSSVPEIRTKPFNITTTVGNYVVLTCEVHGFPIPEVNWEFIPYPEKGTKIKLPSDVLDLAVQTRGGPDSFWVTSWIQILHLRKSDAGIYTCIATNNIGNTTASAIVAVKENIH